MSDSEINLAVLGLCYRHDRSEKEILDRATVLRKFVLSSAATAEEKSTARNKRKTRADKAKAPT